MSHIILKAVPRLIPPPDAVASDIERTPDEWAEVIARLRPRLLSLANRELCGLLREMYLQDLFCLVVNVPYSHDLLARLQEGLSETVWEELSKDCEKQGAALLGDLAAGVYARVNEALTALEESHATKEQQDQLRALSRKMLELDENAFKFCVEGMAIPAMEALFVVTGGLESVWSQRARQVLCAKEWGTIVENYPAMSAEPLQADTLVECITNIPALMEGQPWPKDEDAQTPEEYAAWLARAPMKKMAKMTPWQELKLKISCWKCDRMDIFYEMRDWFRSKFDLKK